MWKVPSSAWRIELAGSCLFQVVPSACVVWNIHQPHVLHIFTSQGITGRQDKRCSKLQGTVRWMTLLQGIRSGTALAAPMRRPRVSWRQHLKQLVWVVVSNIFYFHPFLGKIPILPNIFSDGLKPQPVVVVFQVCIAFLLISIQGNPGIPVKQEVVFFQGYIVIQLVIRKK